MEPNSPQKNNSGLDPRPSPVPQPEGTPLNTNLNMAAEQTKPAGEEAPRRASIHTLEGDIFRAMKDDNYANNIVKIVTDPKTNLNKSQNAEAETKGFIKKIIIASCIFLLIFLGVLAYFFLTGNKEEVTGPNNPNATSTTNGVGSSTAPTIKTTGVLEAEAIIQLDIKSLDKNSGIEKIRLIQQDLRNKQIAAGTTVELTLNLTVPDLFAKNQYSGDEGLVRSLTNDYSFGLYNNKDNRFESFLIFKLASADLAFSNMLAWERYLPSDLRVLFTDTSVVETVIEQPATTTSTTTPPVVASSTPKFSDKILKNTDTRVYTDEFGKVQFVYGFINKEFLIISGGTESFIDVKTRLLNNNTLR